MHKTLLTSYSTEQRDAETEPQAGYLDFRVLAESIPNLIWSARADGAPDYCNGRLLEYLGRSLEEMQGGAWVELLHPDDRQRTVDAWAEALTTGQGFCLEHRFRRAADGQYRWHKGQVVPQRDAASNVVRWFGVCTDIDESRRMKESLRLSEEKYRSLVENTSDCIWETDPNGCYTYLSPKFRDLTGYRPEEFLGKPPLVLLSKDKEDPLRKQLLAGIVAPKPISSLICPIRRRDGRMVMVEVTGIPLFDPAGEYQGMRGITRDITERMQIEERLQESENRFRVFMDNAPTIAWMKDEQGRFAYINKTFEKLCGRSVADIQGKTDFELLPAELAETFRQSDLEVLHSGKNLEVMESCFDVNGKPHHWLNSKFLFVAVGGRRYVGGRGRGEHHRTQGR